MKLTRGWQAEMARRAGISRSFFNRILRGAKRCPPLRARSLELASGEVLGEVITAIQWIEGSHGIFNSKGRG